MQNIKWKLAQSLELKWWRRYLDKKDVDQYLDWKRQYWLDFFATQDIAINPGLRILDAGCGPSGAYMALDGCDVTGVDPLIDSYENELDLFQKADYPHVRFVRSRIEDFREEGAFDLILCINAINHVEDIRKSLLNLRACLRKGGRLFLTTDAHRSNLLCKLFRWVPGDMLHPHQYPASEYRDLLLEAGWQVEEMKVLKAGRIFDYVLFSCK